MIHPYERAFRSVLFPLYETVLRRRRTLSYLREAERTQWISKDEIAAIQLARLRALVAACWQEVPYYRQTWTEAGLSPGDLASLEDLRHFPIITKQDIRENLGRMTAPSLQGEIHYKTTGGSTGEPLRFGYTRESYERRVAMMWRGYAWAGARMGRRTLFIWAGAVGRASWRQTLKDRAFHGFFHRHMLDSFSLNDNNLEHHVDEVARWRPEVIVSYVSPLVRMARWMVERGRTIRGVKSILGAAEALSEDARRIIEAAFPDASAFNTYGCREFMLIAAECGHRRGLHVNADHLVVEIVDGAGTPADSGELVITDLSNYGMPFVRYKNGDVATWSTVQRCACGRGLPLLAEVTGRRLDIIRAPDGRALPGEFFPHLLKDVPGILRFQVVQKRLDALELKIVADAGFTAREEAFVLQQVSSALGGGVELQLHRVDEIPLTASGKFRVTVSEIE